MNYLLTMHPASFNMICYVMIDHNWSMFAGVVRCLLDVWEAVADPERLILIRLDHNYIDYVSLDKPQIIEINTLHPHIGYSNSVQNNMVTRS